VGLIIYVVIQQEKEAAQKENEPVPTSDSLKDVYRVDSSQNETTSTPSETTPQTPSSPRPSRASASENGTTGPEIS